ncbi:MAG: hypothetical protein ACTSYB_16175 [Candidatus Helarchaeota archaeon]
MMQNEDLLRGRNYSKLLKFIGLGAIIALGICIIAGFMFNCLFYLILLYFIVLGAIIGYIGGIWLWEYLATSELITNELKRRIKIGGLFILIGFAAFISFNLYIAFYGDFQFLQMIIYYGNNLLLFMFCYFIGYLLAIWKPQKEPESQKNFQKKFSVDWVIIKRLFRVIIPICGIIFGIFLGIGLIQEQLLNYLLYYGIFLLLVLGFCLGYLIWEHLKKTNLISGQFQMQLKWISIVATGILGMLVGYGFFVLSMQTFQLFQELILYYSVFLICMFFYFIGLFFSIFKSK